MAKKKLSKPKRRYQKKKLTTRTGEKISVSRIHVDFKRSRSIRSKAAAKRFFEKEVAKEVRKVHKRNKNKKIRFSFKGSKKYQNKKVLAGWGVRRFKKKDIDRALQDNLEDFLKDMDRYLSRKDAIAVNFSSIELEVVNEARSKTNKRRRKRKKK